MKTVKPRDLQFSAEISLDTGKAPGDATMGRSDGTTFEGESLSAVYSDKEGRQTASTVVRDISDRKKAQDEILRLNASLEQRVQQRTAQLEAANQELERFSYSIAHDLQSPLASIRGFTQALQLLLQSRAADREKHYLSRILTSATRMDEMINALLELAHLSISPLKVEHLNLSEIATRVLSSCCDLEPSRVLKAKVQERLLFYADRGLITIVMENLIGNAWKFTSRCANAEITVGAESLEGELVCFVKDNGAGFDMACSAKLFGVFQRLHSESEFPGHGVGLANVRRIITRHNGRVWAESAPGQGAVFRFTLGSGRQEAGGASPPR